MCRSSDALSIVSFSLLFEYNAPRSAFKALYSPTLYTPLFCVQRVRRSPYSQNPEYEEACEMTCTMRNWQPKRMKHSDRTLQLLRGSDAFHQGPELLLKAVHSSNTNLSQLDMRAGSERFHSFGSSGQLRSRQQVWNAEKPSRQASPLKRPMGICIALSDVVVADVHDVNLVYLTTNKSGYFEFSFLSRNARDMMCAFLSASLPEERILSSSLHEQHDDGNWQVPTCSFDVEMLTNKRIQERVERETFSEKVKRKVSHVALQIEASEYFYYNHEVVLSLFAVVVTNS